MSANKPGGTKGGEAGVITQRQLEVVLSVVCEYIKNGEDGRLAHGLAPLPHGA